MKLKKIASILLTIPLVAGLAGCAASAAGSGKEAQVVKVGIVGESYYEIWAPVIEALAAEDVTVELVNFADYSLPNAALDSGEIHLNAFQHYTYLNNEIETKGYDLAAIGETFLSAMCVYSDKLPDLGALQAGDKIAIPNDAVNTGRALTVLQGAGIIRLDPAAGKTPEVTDITDNPLELEFVPVDAAQIPSLLPDVAAGVINGNYALDYGLSPVNDAIFYDDLSFYTDNSYINVIAARTQDADNELYQRIVAAYQSDAVEQVFIDYFEGSYLPAWK